MNRDQAKIVGLAVVAALLCLAAVALADEYQLEQSFDADELTVHNLVGEIKVVQAGGDDFQVKVDVRGGDAEKGLIELKSDEGSRAELTILFPVDEEDTFIYPPMGRSRTTIDPRGGRGSTWQKLLGIGDRIEIRGRGRGLEVWADVTIAVPAGKKLLVYHGVGEMSADDVKADLVLDGSSGRVTTRDTAGDLVVDTGSGGVSVLRHSGDLLVDTGSGSVDVTSVTGDEIVVDTGSGGVELEDVVGKTVKVDTGSGGVEANGVEADDMLIDTGSGGVTVELVKMGTGRFVFDTGSGGVRLRLPKNVSAEIEADSGSGGVHVDLDGVEFARKKRDYVRCTVGDGDARILIDTGSGSIRVSN